MIRMAFGSYEEGELLAVPDRHHRTVKALGASAALWLYVAARNHRIRKPGLIVGMVKSAVAERPTF